MTTRFPSKTESSSRTRGRNSVLKPVPPRGVTLAASHGEALRLVCTDIQEAKAALTMVREFLESLAEPGDVGAVRITEAANGGHFTFYAQAIERYEEHLGDAASLMRNWFEFDSGGSREGA